MITSKQRSYLKGLAQKIDATVYIGKQGLTENIIKEIDNGLENRELVKVKIQEGCLLKPKETGPLPPSKGKGRGPAFFCVTSGVPVGGPEPGRPALCRNRG